jgi:hypothetical protein
MNDDFREGWKMNIKSYLKNPKRRDLSGDLDVGIMIILKRSLKK